MLLLLLLLGTPEAARAQSPLKLSGSTGLTAKGYSASGIDNRRAPAELEAFARLSVDLAGLTTGLNLSYSTDQSGVRQSINRLAFSTSWRTGGIAVGDVSTSYTPYSLRGVTTRGGSIEQSLGKLYVSATGGRSRRAVGFSRLEDFRGSSYSQYLFGSRLGIGKPNGSHFHIIAVYGRDIAGSLPDTTSLRPAENLTLTPSFSVSLLNGAVKIGGDVTGSLFTEDQNAIGDLDSSLPEFIRPIVGINASSRGDLAANAEFALQQPTYGLTATFSRIQPGFKSLGVQQVRSDEQTIRIAPRFQLAQGRVAVSTSVARSENNLLDNLESSLVRDQMDAALQLQVSQSFMIAAAGNFLRNLAEPTGASNAIELQQKQIGQMFMLSPTLILRSAGGTSHTATVTATTQVFDDQSDAVVAGLRPGFKSSTRSAMAAYSIRFPSAISVTLTGNIVSSDASTSDARIRSGTLSVGLQPITGLSTTVGGGWSGNTLSYTNGPDVVENTSTQWTGTLSASYAVSRAASLRLQVRGIANRSTQDFGDFEELQSSLSFTHRF